MEKFYFTHSQMLDKFKGTPQYYENIGIRVILNDEDGNADTEYGMQLQFKCRGKLSEPILQMNPSELSETMEFFGDFIQALNNRSHKLDWLKATEAIEILDSLGYKDMSSDI